jgi:hypothetical protein
MRGLPFQMHVLIALLSAGLSYAEPLGISNVRFSDNPITVGEWFTMTFDYDGKMEKYTIENIYESLT